MEAVRLVGAAAGTHLVGFNHQVVRDARVRLLLLQRFLREHLRGAHFINTLLQRIDFIVRELIRLRMEQLHVATNVLLLLRSHILYSVRQRRSRFLSNFSRHAE